MDSVLPFSVLKSKRTKHIRIIDDQVNNNDSPYRPADYEKNIQDLIAANLYIIPEHIFFINKYMYFFYRNNLAVLLLALNILHDGNFVNTQYYRSYVEYIQRRQLGEDKADKQEMFDYKFNVQMNAYIMKIQNLMSREHLTSV